MKVELLRREPDEFKPIKLEVIIETKDDLLELWHRLNVSRDEIVKGAKDSTVPLPDKFSSIPVLWKFLDDNFVRPRK